MFPNISGEGGPPQLTQQDLTFLYDKAIRPAVVAHTHSEIAHWPVSYSAALKLSRDNNGQLHTSSLDIDEWSLPEFATHLLANLADNPRLKDAFFMIELRGTKGLYPFNYRHRATEAPREWNHCIERINLDDEDRANWYIDLGMEIKRPGYVLQWLTAGHRKILEKAIPSSPRVDVEALMSGNNFEVDVSGHLFDLSGFRCNPGAKGKRDKVVHVNVYTTDKSASYQLHRGAFSPHSCTSLYPANIEKLMKDMDIMGDTFLECAGARGTIQDGTARWEIRVQIDAALALIPRLTDQFLQQCVICIPSEIWW